jgi:hypothetical protein
MQVLSAQADASTQEREVHLRRHILESQNLLGRKESEYESFLPIQRCDLSQDLGEALGGG